jgi:hypothetical protein
VETNGLFVTYETTSAIPGQSIDTTVQYYVQAEFDGLFSHAASPKCHKRFTNPAWYYPVDLNDRFATSTVPYYIVFSCYPKEVWINEFNVTNDVLIMGVPVTQYVELAGVAGSDITRWQLEVFETNMAYAGLYRISTPTVLANESNGYGFWVLGENTMSEADKYLTNGIPVHGGVRLVRSMGAYEHAICFGESDGAKAMTNNPAERFQWVGADGDWFIASPVALEGTGENLYDFSASDWKNDSWVFTPGALNHNQTLEKNIVPPDVEVIGFWMTSSNVWIVCTGSNGWHPTPWYSTNLLSPGGGWSQVTDFDTQDGDGVHTQTFDLVGGYTQCFYKVVSTNGP